MHATTLLAIVVSASSITLARADLDSTTLVARSIALADDPATAAPAAVTQSEAGKRVLDPDAPRPWTVRVDPIVWYVAPSGKVQLPATSGDGPGSATSESDKVRVRELDLNSPRLRPAGDIAINADDWRFVFSGANFDNSRSGIAADRAFRLGAVNVAPGDRFDASFEMGMYELNVGYRFIRHDFQAASKVPEDAIPLVVSVYGLAGARIYDVTFAFERSGGAGPRRAGFDDLFVEPLIGGRLEAEFTKSFGVEVQASAGYLPGGSDRSSFSVDVAAGFYYRPLENLGVILGYRQLAVDIEDGDGVGKFRYDGRLAGVFFGVELRF